MEKLRRWISKKDLLPESSMTNRRGSFSVSTSPGVDSGWNRKSLDSNSGYFLRRLCSVDNIPTSDTVWLETDEMEPIWKQLNCQDSIFELYQQLVSTGSSQLTADFENVVSSMLSDVKDIQTEKERVEKSLKREKENHSLMLRQLEKDLEEEIQKVEMRVRIEERDIHGQQQSELKQHMQVEIIDLRRSLAQAKVRDAIPESMSAANLGAEAESLRNVISELQSEKRRLQSEQTDMETTLALMRSDMVHLRQNYDEKCRELDFKKKSFYDCLKEQDNLTRQLHMLHDANRKLQDANDDLQAAVEKGRHQTTMRESLQGSRVSLMSQNGSVQSPGLLRLESVAEGDMNTCSLADEINNTECTAPVYRSSTSFLSAYNSESLSQADVASCHTHTGQRTSSPRRNVAVRRDKSGSFDEDSGLSTFKESGYSFESDTFHTTGERSTKLDVGIGDLVTQHVRKSRHEYDTDMEGRDTCPSDFTTSCYIQRSPMYDQERKPSLRQRTSDRRSKRQSSRRVPNVTAKTSNDPERMFKIVLVGDAAVGKSSFILRLCKNKFVSNLTSTLGVDFQTKLIDVDGRNVALQLWDTAGQERFRSIATSYFRRADGVILMYDVSFEKSFLNVRQWIASIQDSCQKNLPIILVGNKVDLRENVEGKSKTCVTFEEGQRIAREYDAMYAETSVRDGWNVEESVKNLARLLRTTEDLEVRQAGLQLSSIDKKSSCCI